MSTELAFIDYAVLIAYLLGTVALGIAIGRRISTGTDFFLAGRRLPWWAIGLSLVATDIGGTDIMGVGGAAYSHGLAVANFEWIGCIPAMIIGAFIFIPYFYRTGVYTIPEFMERRYNAGVRTALGFCWLLFMACNLGIMLFASAKMMDGMFGTTEIGAETTTATLVGWILATAFLVGIYTCVGGLAAVVYTDTIQCAVMIAGCLLVLVLGLWDIGGVGELRQKVEALERAELADDASDDDGVVERTSLVLPVDTKSPFPWTGIFFGLGLVLSPAYWLGNQAIVQRSLGARSEFEAKASYVWGAVLKNVIPFIIAVPGLIAVVKFPELQDGDQAFPSLVSALLPTGLRGLFLAAFVAALMSSVDSYLNAAATIVTNDIYKRFINPHADERRMLSIGRLVTVGLVLWAIGFAWWLTMAEDTGIYAIFQTLLSFFQGPALAILLCGILWQRANGIGAFCGFVFGVLFSISLFTLNQESVYTSLGIEPLFQIADPFLYFSVWSFLFSLSLVVGISLLTRPEPDEKVAGLIYHRRRRPDA